MDIKNLKDYPPFMKVSQFAELMQLSRGMAHAYVHQKGFTMFRIGKSIRVNRDTLISYLENLQGEK